MSMVNHLGMTLEIMHIIIIIMDSLSLCRHEDYQLNDVFFKEDKVRMCNIC